MNDQPQGPPQKSGEPSRQGGQPSGGQTQGQYQTGTPTQGKPDPCPPPPEPDPCAPPTPVPTPTPTPCPDPCDQDRPWGPPLIPAECCPHRECCPEDDGSDAGSGDAGSGDSGSEDGGSEGSGSQGPTVRSANTKGGSNGETNGGSNGDSNGSETKTPTCTWDEVDDPCIRATAGKDIKHSIFTCTCTSSNAECTCAQWEYGGYPEGVCVPCSPCQGLIPTDGGGSGSDDGCGDDGDDKDCGSVELQQQLDALKMLNSSRQGAKARLEARIKAGQDREKELATLVAGFDDIVKGYTDNLPKLKSREDTLKGFYSDTRKLFTKRYSKDCLDKLQDEINAELIQAELIKCCQKNLKGRLERVTLLQQAKDDADKGLKKAEDAFKAIKDLNKWIGEQFGSLETLRDQILQALADKDPQRYKWAFYLFYWKFVPQLCRRFPVELCCGPKEKPLTLGCKHGDWHPSRIDADLLKVLIHCAWCHMKGKKQEAQRAADALADVTRNLEYITSQVPDDKALDTLIKTRLDKVACATAPATSR